MAGGIAKTFGVLFIVLGVLAILAGIAAAGYAYMEHEGAKGETLGSVTYSQEEQDQNQLIAMAGVGAAGVGLLFLVLGIVFVALGSGAAHRATLREIAGHGRAAGGAPADGQPEPAPPVVRSKTSVRGAAIGGGIALGLVVLLAVPLLFAGTIQTQPGGGEAAPTLMGNQNIEGTAAGGTVAGVSASAPTARHQHTLNAPGGATRLVLGGAWTAGDDGAQQLRFQVQRETADGWVEVGGNTGTSPLQLQLTFPAEATLRLNVYVDDGAASAGQAFQATVQFWDK